ncbi:hypothetical protein [Nocardia cyriacigeorgica]|uniref:hypothetical protein n=1 Tax=Nocardia cyriacigeorgica TaxID=135487 RepID=UPI002455C3E6|nr:hypothetical protein [Nocardia cyriacigeorgica]
MTGIWFTADLHRNSGERQNVISTSSFIRTEVEIMPSPYGNLVRLLEDSPQAAYWIGFLAADGYFTDCRVRVTVNQLDYAHLLEFTSWLGVGTPIAASKNNSVTFSMANAETVRTLRTKFDFRDRKTYSPPRHLPYQDTTLLTAWLIGYIDGDGHIKRQTGRQTAVLDTVAHLSWKPLLEEIAEKLGIGYVNERLGHADYPGRRYAAFRCARHNQIADLKRFAMQHSLPILTRKWDKVDTSIVVDHHEKADRMRALIRSGKRTTEIARELGCGKAAVSNMRARMRAASIVASEGATPPNSVSGDAP